MGDLGGLEPTILVPQDMFWDVGSSVATRRRWQVPSVLWFPQRSTQHCCAWKGLSVPWGPSSPSSHFSV